jgi:glucuronate isomerase
MLIHQDRLFPAEASTRKTAKTLYEQVRTLPIVGPHGHMQAVWFARNEPFADPAKPFVQPDHYIYRTLYSQGISLEDLEIGQPELKDARRVWHIFARHYYLFRGTPTRMWLDFAFQELFGLDERLSEATADLYFDTISETLRAQFLPRALYERFNLEVLATTDSPLDSLDDHKAIRESNWKARILPTFRPDPVVDPEFAGFAENIANLVEKTGEGASTWAGYLNAAKDARPLPRTRLHRNRPRASHRTNRQSFPSRGCEALLSSARRQCRCPAAGTLSRTDADRNGADEPRRRVGHADSPGQRAQLRPKAL